MPRLKRSFDFLESVNLDSLMDLLTCTVGFLLVVVILSVIDARGVSIPIFRPIASEPKEGTKRMTFICSEGRIRPFLIDSIFREATRGVNYNNIPSLIKAANKKRYTDGFFYYFFDFEETFVQSYFFYTSSRRDIIVLVEENGNDYGETAIQLKSDSSRVASLIKSFKGEKVWCSFLLADDESIEVFRTVRSLASKDSIASGWDPAFIEFPYVVNFTRPGEGKIGIETQ